MRSYHEILKRALITEKAVKAQEEKNRYAFEVALNATKPMIREAVEDLFKVEVHDIHTMIQRGKAKRFGRHQGRMANWKKAIVTVKKGQKIPIFEVK